MTLLRSGIDHVGILVRNMDAAQATYQALGFTLTERAQHSRFGTCNHTFVFRDDYCELLGVAEPGPENLLLQQSLKAFEGLWLIAFATSDVGAVHDELVRIGVGVIPPQDYSRHVMVESSLELARFTSLQIAPSATPGAMSIVCQHHTPNLVWLPHLQTHANGAVGIASLTLVVDEPEEALRRYQQLLGSAPAGGAMSYPTFKTGRHEISIAPQRDFDRDLREAGITPMAFAPPFLGQMTLYVDCLQHTEAWFANQRIDHVRTPEALTINPADACGVVLTFRQQPSRP